MPGRAAGMVRRGDRSRISAGRVTAPAPEIPVPARNEEDSVSETPGQESGLTPAEQQGQTRGEAVVHVPDMPGGKTHAGQSSQIGPGPEAGQ